MYRRSVELLGEADVVGGQDVSLATYSTEELPPAQEACEELLLLFDICFQMSKREKKSTELVKIFKDRQ